MDNNYNNFQEDDFLSQWDKKNSFALPKGYFDSLSNRILNKIEHEQELSAYKTLSENRKSSFKVPQNYFETLANSLEYKYELSTFPELANTKKPILKALPDNYFENLEKKVVDKVELESELKAFSVLSSIPKKNAFKVAPAYFESKTEDVKEKIHSTKHESGIVRQLIAIIFKPQMAIAASLVLIVGISAIWYFNRKDTTVLTGDCMTLACLEKNEILNEKNIQDFDDESLYEMVDESVLDQQLSEDETSEDSLNTNKE
jgi:hypothetical protein